MFRKQSHSEKHTVIKTIFRSMIYIRQHANARAMNLKKNAADNQGNLTHKSNRFGNNM